MGTGNCLFNNILQNIVICVQQKKFIQVLKSLRLGIFSFGWTNNTIYLFRFSFDLLYGWTHVFGRESGSFNMVRAAWTMAIGVATYPASGEHTKMMDMRNMHWYINMRQIWIRYLVLWSECGSCHWVCPHKDQILQCNPLQETWNGKRSPPSADIAFKWKILKNKADSLDDDDNTSIIPVF